MGLNEEIPDLDIIRLDFENVPIDIFRQIQESALDIKIRQFG